MLTCIWKAMCLSQGTMSHFLSQSWPLSIVTVCVHYPCGQFSADNRTLSKHLMRFIPISRTQSKGGIYLVTTLHAFGLYWICFTQERNICDEGPKGPFHQTATWDGHRAIWWSLGICPRAFLVTQIVKNLSAMQETQVRSLGRERSSPVFLPGEAHGQRSLAGYSP